MLQRENGIDKGQVLFACRACQEDINFIDDPNWDQRGPQETAQKNDRNAWPSPRFPEVGQALKPHSSVEERSVQRYVLNL